MKSFFFFFFLKSMELTTSSKTNKMRTQIVLYQKVGREHCKQLHTSTFKNLDEKDNFFKNTGYYNSPNIRWLIWIAL